MFITVCWLTHRLMLSFLTQPRTFPRNDAAHGGLHLPKAISNQSFSQTCPQASLIVIIPQWRLPSQATPGCVKLTILITNILTGQPFNYYDVFYMSIIKPITQHQLFVLKSCVSPLCSASFLFTCLLMNFLSFSPSINFQRFSSAFIYLQTCLFWLSPSRTFLLTLVFRVVRGLVF